MFRRYAEPFLHLVFWILISYLAYNSFGMKIISFKSGHVEQTTYLRNDIWILLTVDMIFKIMLFYVTSFKLLPSYFIESKWVQLYKMVLLLIGTFLISLMVNYLLINYVVDFSPISYARLLSLSLLLHCFTLLLALAYSLLKDKMRQEKLQKLIKQEKLKTELDFLKSQVNPHFLFNTLNNLYAEANKLSSPTLTDGIAKLSHMMRYMLYESNEPFVALTKEIEFLESFISLQMLRISPTDPFELIKEIDPVSGNMKVAPILFQPILENAFKHGVKIEEASFVHMSLKKEDERLCFSVENSKSNQSIPIKHSGLGLKNLRRRLELLYPRTHSLEVIESDETFKVTLSLWGTGIEKVA